ncbi:hypothetical protein H6F51_24625 [Cyanobacteria bacterium FACHB-DQ100]|nr:hypothetical protein [Cyanobacteria bacterium FACHB-DQ100]
MEEIDFLMNSEPAIVPMTIEAWVILAFMLGLVAWGLWELQQKNLLQQNPLSLP